jgi:hypothetical protein
MIVVEAFTPVRLTGLLSVRLSVYVPSGMTMVSPSLAASMQA